MNWHDKTAAEAMAYFSSGLSGLSGSRAAERLLEFGENEIKRARRRSWPAMLLDQFKDFMIIVLIVAALISGFVGELTDTITIIVIVILNAIIGFVQEYRAERAIEALRQLASPNATVIREGQRHVIPAAKIVPGDVIVIEAGNIVPADARLLESQQLRVNEAALTGESLTVDKDCAVIPDAASALGDRKNTLFKGTTVTNGRARALVTATGMNTELGKIATMLEQEEEVKTPLQKRLARFGTRLAIAFLVICAVVFVIGVLRGEKVPYMFLTAISLAVAAIPEALPAVVTIALAIGAKKLVQQNALIRKLPAVETLGSVTYICTDKTGTLTQNRMVVQEIFVNGRIIKRSDPPIHEFPYNDLYLAMALSNDAWRDDRGNVQGDPTETSLYQAAFDAGFEKERLADKYPRLAEIPFDSDRKRMTTFHRCPDGGIVSYTKGAIEILMDRYRRVLSTGGVLVDREKFHLLNERMAADGLRVLAIGLRRWDEVPADLDPEAIESELEILGLIGIEDPLRDEVRDAVATCKSAGIIPVMITGDHPITARAVARKLGIIDEDYDLAEIITGRVLAAMPLEEFEKKVATIRVYARVAPEQKLKIIKALQDIGQFAAMTGDGVNDAPALKRADIGVAMGITGTDVAKEASHMILLDDNFATIVRAVREGRRIFDNLRKFVKYLLTTNSGEIWTLFLAPLIGLPVPLLPIHILWINLMTDSLPALALAAEPVEGEIMKRPPRHPQESIFSHGLGVHVIWVGLLMGGIAIATQAWAIHIGDAHWQTMVFNIVCLTQLGHVLAIRSEKASLFKIGLLSNKPLLGAVLVSISLQAAVTYVPFLHPVFKTQALQPVEFLICILLSSVIFVAVEIEKLIKRRRR